MRQTTYIRAAKLAPAEGKNLIPCVVSSDAPVSRDGFKEVLVHTPAAIDLSRGPIPVIESHDSKKLNIGIVEQLTIVGGKLRGMLRLGKSARAQEILQDVQDVNAGIKLTHFWVIWPK